MTTDTIATSTYYLVMLALVVSAFALRRLPLRRTLTMLLSWVAIFVVGFVLVSFRHDLGDLFVSRIAGRAIVEGSTVRIPMAEDGHFWVDARINPEMPVLRHRNTDGAALDDGATGDAADEKIAQIMAEADKNEADDEDRHPA